MHVHVYVQEAHVMITCVFICPIYVHVYMYTIIPRRGIFSLSTVLYALVFVTVFVVAKTMDDLTLWGEGDAPTC